MVRCVQSFAFFTKASFVILGNVTRMVFLAPLWLARRSAA